MGKIYQYDIGKEMRIDTGIDLTGYQEIKIYVLTPTGVTTWTPTATSGDTEMGETAGYTILKYITQANDFVELGTYIGADYVKFSETSGHTGEPFKFVVYERFKPA